MTKDKERLITAQWILERQLNWISGAEVKIGVVVTIDIAMIASVASLLGAEKAHNAWVTLFAVLSLLALISSLICAACSVIPRLNGPRSSLLFFGKIQELTITEYSDRLRSATDFDLLKDCSDQIHRNAEIALIKHQWVRNAMCWSFLSVLPWVGFIIMILK